MGLTTQEYLFDLELGCRLRHRHTRTKNKVIDFAVQIEVRTDDQWTPVVRYDTAHGFAHQDIMHADGKVEKIPMFARDYNEALTLAEADLKTNWALYKSRFLEEKSR